MCADANSPILFELSSKTAGGGRAESHRNFSALGEGLVLSGKCPQGNLQDRLFWVSRPHSDDIKVMHCGNRL